MIYIKGKRVTHNCQQKYLFDFKGGIRVLTGINREFSGAKKQETLQKETALRGEIIEKPPVWHSEKFGTGISSMGGKSPNSYEIPRAFRRGGEENF